MKSATVVFLVVCLLVATTSIMVDQVEAGNKGSDIVISNGKIIVRGGKKDGDIVIDQGGFGRRR